MRPKKLILHIPMRSLLRSKKSIARPNSLSQPRRNMRWWRSPYRRYRNIPETKLRGTRSVCGLVKPHLR